MADLISSLHLKAKGIVWYASGEELKMLVDENHLVRLWMRPDIHQLFEDGQTKKMQDIAQRTPLPYGLKEAGVMELIDYCMAMTPPDWAEGF